jgi:hypothetical protein
MAIERIDIPNRARARAGIRWDSGRRRGLETLAV